jgi:hypothetical protein
MTVLVACETVLLVLLVLLVAGLLRSHAEILRRLGPPQDRELPEPARRAAARAAHDLAGLTPQHDALKVGLGDGSPPTLVAFLTSGCTACERFWQDLRADRRPPELPSAVRVVAVTKDSSHESPARLRGLAPPTVPVVMSSAAWRDYGVPAAPYFVYVDGGRVHGEGSASTWQQIASLLRDAIEDHAGASGGERRTVDVDRALSAAGIGPGHPSLYPGGGADGEDHAGVDRQ